MRSEDQRAAKLLAVKFGSLKKVYHPAMAIVEPLGSSSTLTGQGVLRSIWSGRLECFFVDPEGAKNSKNGNNIICTL